MSHNNTVYAQLLKLIPRHEFEKLNNQLRPGRKTPGMTSWDQFVSLAFSQLSNCQSLRDIENGLLVQKSKLYHLGIKPVARSSFSRWNNNQDYRLFESLFYCLQQRCHGIGGKHKFKFKNPLYSLDSSLIDLSLKCFPWADVNNRGKGALKLHVGLNHNGYIPEIVRVTQGKRPDVLEAKDMTFPTDSIVLIDKGYTSFEYYKSLIKKENFFVTRLKKKLKHSITESRPVDGSAGISCDQSLQFTGPKAQKCELGVLRKVGYTDLETGKQYTFLTNHFGLSAATIAALYKERWQVELFFKHIKQNLKLKRFLGASLNALLTQIWVAMCVHLLLAYIKWTNKLQWPIQRMMRLLAANLFAKISLLDVLGRKPPDKDEGPPLQAAMVW